MTVAKQALRASPLGVSAETTGRSAPLGATVVEGGVNFSLFSRTAASVELLFFDRDDDAPPSRVVPIDPAENRTYHYWHVFVPGVRPGQIYGYRVGGPSDPGRGLRIDREKVLLDPYGRGVVVPKCYDREAARRTGDNAATAMKSVVVDPGVYDWEGDLPLNRPSARTIIYEMHVRGFTRNPSSGVSETTRGTFAGLVEKIPYLNLTRLRPTRRRSYRVTIFGSARTDPGHWAYAAVRDLAAELTRLGCDIVTGGGPGLMRAANEGSCTAGGGPDRSSVGIRVDLPFEQDVNPFVSQVFEHRTFFSRLHHFVLVSDAFVVVPGGIGTVLETMMIWQLLPVRKLHETPLILVGAMWADLVEWSRNSMLRSDGPLASPEDFAIPLCCRTGPEALDILREQHSRWKASQEATS